MKILANQLVLPEHEVSVMDLLRHDKGFTTDGKAEKLIANTGFTHFRACRTPSMNLFVQEACASLSEPLQATLADVKAVVAVSQSFEYVNPNHSSRIQAHLDLPGDIQFFDLVDGCNGFVKALTLVERILEPNEKALIMTGELHSLVSEGSEVGTRALLGDGLAFSIVEREAEPMRALVRSDGKQGYNITTQLHPPSAKMNGVEVFNFTHMEVARLIKQADWVSPGDESQIFALHQANRFIVNNIGKQLKIRDQTPALFNCQNIGNLSSASIPAWMAHAAQDDKSWQEGKKLHCVGFGSGLSWGIATINTAFTRNQVTYIEI